MGWLLLTGVLTMGMAAEPSGVDADLSDSATATPEQMQAFAVGAAKQVAGHLTAVEKLTKQAQAQSDADVLACLIPKNTSLKALKQVVDGSRVAVQENTDAMTPATEKVARYHYRLIAVSLRRAFALHQAAESCFGRDLQTQGRLIVEVIGGVGDEPDYDPAIDDELLDGVWIGWNPPPPTQYLP